MRHDDRTGRFDDPSPADIAQNKFFMENVTFPVVNSQYAVAIKGMPGTFKKADLLRLREKHGWPSFHYPLVRHLPNWKQYIKPAILARPIPFTELMANQKRELEALTSEGATTVHLN